MAKTNDRVRGFDKANRNGEEGEGFGNRIRASQRNQPTAHGGGGNKGNNFDAGTKKGAATVTVPVLSVTVRRGEVHTQFGFVPSYTSGICTLSEEVGGGLQYLTPREEKSPDWTGVKSLGYNPEKMMATIHKPTFTLPVESDVRGLVLITSDEPFALRNASPERCLNVEVRRQVSARLVALAQAGKRNRHLQETANRLREVALAGADLDLRAHLQLIQPSFFDQRNLALVKALERAGAPDELIDLAAEGVEGFRASDLTKLRGQAVAQEGTDKQARLDPDCARPMVEWIDAHNVVLPVLGTHMQLGLILKPQAQLSQVEMVCGRSLFYGRTTWRTDRNGVLQRDEQSGRPLRRTVLIEEAEAEAAGLHESILRLTFPVAQGVEPRLPVIDDALAEAQSAAEIEVGKIEKGMAAAAAQQNRRQEARNELAQL